MAEGFARYYAAGSLEPYSAGSKPSGVVNQDAILVMKETGIDISGQHSKGLGDLPAKEFDYVITMGCKDICPFVPAKKHTEWNIDDPKGRSLGYFREVRDKIKENMQKLIEEINDGKAL